MRYSRSVWLRDLSWQRGDGGGGGEGWMVCGGVGGEVEDEEGLGEKLKVGLNARTSSSPTRDITI